MSMCSPRLMLAMFHRLDVEPNNNEGPGVIPRAPTHADGGVFPSMGVCTSGLAPGMQR